MSCDFVLGEFSVSGVDDVDGAVESLLDLDLGMDEMMPADGRLDRVDDAGEAHGVVVGDCALVFGAEDRRKIQRGVQRPPGGRRI